MRNPEYVCSMTPKIKGALSTLSSPNTVLQTLSSAYKIVALITTDAQTALSTMQTRNYVPLVIILFGIHFNIWIDLGQKSNYLWL